MERDTFGVNDKALAITPGGIHAHTMQEVPQGVSMLALCFGVMACPMTLMSSWWVLDPNQEAVVINFGVFTDHVREPGCHFNNYCGRDIKLISTQNISYDLTNQKITDSSGNPLVVSAVITYRFTNARAALFNVQSPQQFVCAQAAAALKTVVGRYTYDELKLESDDVAKAARDLLQPRVDVAGATILSVSLNELNYAPEIANAMLKKQAAQALVDARHLIVKGALSIALSTVSSLNEQGLKMNDDQKFDLVEKILIVTTGDHDTTPTISM